MRASFSLLAMLLALFGSALTSPDAHAGTRAARKALDELNEGVKPYNVVQNRFFLKANRFEVAPVLGYVPNNPMVKRYVGGLLAGYHFSETLAAEGAIMYAPDLKQNDLKDLTNTLVRIAAEGKSVEFQQPLDKMTLGATFAARWAPVYGKINLIGERVLNFDFYLVGGLGMLSVSKYYATYDSDTGGTVVSNQPEKKAVVPVNLGFGMNFFANGSMAVKLDARSYLYADKKPDYDPTPGTQVTESRLYNAFVASVGVSVFFPKMQARQFQF